MLVWSGSALSKIPEYSEHSSASANRPPLQRMVVLNLQLTGDTGGSRFQAEHKQRIEWASTKLRDEFKRHHTYTVIDDPSSRALIEKAGIGQNLHHCNGCELDVAKQLNADLILVPWIYRVSNLVLTLHVEIRDASTGRIVMKKALDFKGDNDTGWTRAIDYLMKTMKNRRTLSAEL